MEEYPLIKMKELWSRFQKKILCRVLLEVATKAGVHPSFSLIGSKLEKNVYITPFDFALDVRSLIQGSKKVSGSDRNAVLAISDLASWFERRLVRLPRSKEEDFALRLARAKRRMEEIRRAMSLAAASRLNVEGMSSTDQQAPRHAPTQLLNEIQSLLSKDLAPGTQLKLLSVLKRHIPNFSPAEVVTLQASDLSLRCAEEIRDVLKKKKDDVVERCVDAAVEPAEEN
jgi:hypothetical protein